MIDICTMNKISACGTDRLDPAVFTVTDALENAAGVMVRSASLHEISFPASLYAIARAGVP